MVSIVLFNLERQQSAVAVVVDLRVTHLLASDELVVLAAVVVNLQPLAVLVARQLKQAQALLHFMVALVVTPLTIHLHFPAVAVALVEALAVTPLLAQTQVLAALVIVLILLLLMPYQLA
jgi:hypothetical protein